MLTAMLAAENIALGLDHDVWAVNVDDEYHEEASTGRAAPRPLSPAARKAG